MGLRRKGEGLVSCVVLYAREAGTGGWRGAVDGDALGVMGCWATSDGRESLEGVSLALESRNLESALESPTVGPSRRWSEVP